MRSTPLRAGCRFPSVDHLIVHATSRLSIYPPTPQPLLLNHLIRTIPAAHCTIPGCSTSPPPLAAALDPDAVSGVSFYLPLQHSPHIYLTPPSGFSGTLASISIGVIFVFVFILLFIFIIFIIILITLIFLHAPPIVRHFQPIIILEPRKIVRLRLPAGRFETLGNTLWMPEILAHTRVTSLQDPLDHRRVT